MNTWYWLAINGASCAMASFPLPMTVVATPRPQMLVGFPSHKEAVSAQHSMLTARIGKCRKLLAGWKKRKDIVIKVFKNPEPTTNGPTLWQDRPWSEK